MTQPARLAGAAQPERSSSAGVAANLLCVLREVRQSSRPPEKCPPPDSGVCLLAAWLAPPRHSPHRRPCHTAPHTGEADPVCPMCPRTALPPSPQPIITERNTGLKSPGHKGTTCPCPVAGGHPVGPRSRPLSRWPAYMAARYQIVLVLSHPLDLQGGSHTARDCGFSTNTDSTRLPFTPAPQALDSTQTIYKQHATAPAPQALGLCTHSTRLRPAFQLGFFKHSTRLWPAPRAPG